ncbi:MAG: hypothetical protein HN842_06710, partial [Gammaproteobacteria bacterium]|nr:hypothetical protein [Gammaproteobacteria bacterium]
MATENRAFINSHHHGIDPDTQASAVELSYTILSAELLLQGDYYRNGDDLIIRGNTGEEITIEGYFSADPSPQLQTPAGAALLPETVHQLLINTDSIEVAGPAGSLAIPGVLGDPIGVVDEIGAAANVTAKGSDGRIRTLKEGDPIYQDDVVETIGRSFAGLRMVDDTSFQLGKETRAIIENYEFNANSEQGKFEATVTNGFFRYASGKLGGEGKGGHHSTIKTPTAQIGIRGSELEGQIASDGTTTFVHRSGILDVSDVNGRGTVTLTEPGSATAVSFRPGPPSPAFEAPESITQIFNASMPPTPQFVVEAQATEKAEQQEEEQTKEEEALADEELTEKDEEQEEGADGGEEPAEGEEELLVEGEEEILDEEELPEGEEETLEEGEPEESEEETPKEELSQEDEGETPEEEAPPESEEITPEGDETTPEGEETLESEEALESEESIEVAEAAQESEQPPDVEQEVVKSEPSLEGESTDQGREETVEDQKAPEELILAKGEQPPENMQEREVPDGELLVGADEVGPDGVDMAEPDGMDLARPAGEPMVGPDGMAITGADGEPAVDPDGMIIGSPNEEVPNAEMVLEGAKVASLMSEQQPEATSEFTDNPNEPISGDYFDTPLAGEFNDTGAFDDPFADGFNDSAAFTDSFTDGFNDSAAFADSFADGFNDSAAFADSFADGFN